MLSKFIKIVKQGQYHIFLAICIGLISFISYNLGRMDSDSGAKLKISEGLSTQTGANIYSAISTDEKAREDVQITPKLTPKPLDMRVVVSKASDSMRYHYSWCGSWKKIKPENQVWFNSDKEAEAAGYTLAGNCTK